MTLIDIGGNWIEDSWLIWPVDEMRRRNIDLRQQRVEGRFPSGALAFSDAGADGIVFAFDATHAAGVFAWYPQTTERDVKASSLREFLRGWVAGEIVV